MHFNTSLMEKDSRDDHILPLASLDIVTTTTSDGTIDYRE